MTGHAAGKELRWRAATTRTLLVMTGPLTARDEATKRKERTQKARLLSLAIGIEESGGGGGAFGGSTRALRFDRLAFQTPSARCST